MTELAAELGLEYHLDAVQAGNTFDAHRLIHLAAGHGLGDAMEERLFAAYFTEGRSVGDRASLAGLAAEVGLDPDEVEPALQGATSPTRCAGDEARASALGISGVPFFVIDEAYGVSGAQPADVLLGALERAWSESHPATTPASMAAVAEGPACADGACPV